MEPTEKKKLSKGAAAAIIAAAAVALAGVVLLVMTLTRREAPRFASPLEYYQYVETRSAASAGEAFAGTYGAALEALDYGDRHVDAAASLTLYEPAARLLKSYTGEDFSWLKNVELSVASDLTEDGAGAAVTLGLNGRELIGLEYLADTADETLYARVPRLSEDYFEGTFADFGLGDDVLRYREDWKALSAALPDPAALQDLWARCADAALARIGTVEQGSGTLSAGDVSAEYTTLTATLTEEELRALAADVCAVLREDAALREFLLALEDLSGEALYDGLLHLWETLPDSEGLAGGAAVTLYVDADDTVRGRAVEFGENVYRYAAPEKDGHTGFEWSRRDALGADFYDAVAGGWTREGSLYSGTFNLTWDGTEYLSLEFAGLDLDRRAEGELFGVFTFYPTADFYKALGFYNLTARTLEDFSYTLTLDGKRAIGAAYMDGDPFLTLALALDSGPAAALSVPADAAELGSWAMSLLLGGGLNDYLEYLETTDLPPELLENLLGALF